MKALQRAWYERQPRPWLYLLWPLSLLFRAAAVWHRRRQQARARPRGEAPVIVVGNISLGGTGKTALLIALAREFRRRGFAPGVISRGYGANSGAFPRLAQADSDPSECGDEPVLIAANTGCPVVVDPDRNRALERLLADFKVDLVLSDDGLQHYHMHRDVEIIVVDGERGFGNGLTLPAGPLREPVRRLGEADLVVVNGEPDGAFHAPAHLHRVAMEPKTLVHLRSGEERPFDESAFPGGETLQLVCGIGNPARFFELMRKLPNPLVPFEFPDHHRFRAEDFAGGGIDPERPVVITEKDAVKCRGFARDNFWALRADMKLPRELIEALLQKLGNSLEANRHSKP